MIIKCGIDIVEDRRIMKLGNQSNFINKLLHPSERKFKDKLPSIFSLKEATIKALELQLPSWLEIEIVYNINGKTNIRLSDSIKPKGLISIDSSVSHESGITVAQIVILLDG